MLKRFLSSRRDAPPPPSIPEGERVYAIGDVHGRLDLLDILLDRIRRDDAERSPARTTLIFLGDLVDRGPDSAGVVERVRSLHAEGWTVRCLLGNHEEMFLAALDGKRDAMRAFCRVGGRETAFSYGIPPADYEGMEHADLTMALLERVPEAHRTFIESLEDVIVIGDYAFVHAGIRPGVALDAQRTSDLRWIREPFLTHRGGFEKVIVHGHTITPEVDEARRRIGIDTGAYASGCLTALCLQGDSRTVFDTRSAILSSAA